MSFPCLRAVALQRAGVKMGIQNVQRWIPADAGMTNLFNDITIRFSKR